MTRLRIVETAMGIMGPYAGQIFAQLGAQVVKCEPPGGDWSHTLGPSDQQGLGRDGGLFIALARGKEVKKVDLSAVDGRNELRKLVEQSDVILCGPELEVAGITDHALAAWNPGIVRTHFHPIASAGPYATQQATCIQLLALGGIMGITGDPKREPLQIPGHHPEYLAGIHGFTATGAALLRRDRSSERSAERVEVSAFEAVAATAEMICTMYTYTGAIRSRFYGRQPWGIQGEVLPCKDGFVGVHPGALETLALVIGRPDLVSDRLFTDGIYRLTHADEFLALLRPYLAERTREEIIADCEALRVPFGAVLEIPDLLRDQQLLSRDYFDEIRLGDRPVRVPGPLYRRVFKAVEGETTPDGSLSSVPAGASNRPLAGIRVVDLSWVWAGPSATRILADLGAEVIKIEAPHRPDSVRALVQDGNVSHPDYWNRSGYFNEKNLGKRGMTLDIAKPEGKEIFLDLVRQSDVVVESFSPRVMAQFGLDFQRLADERPGIIMVSLSGYGQTGPTKNRVAYGAALEPEAGITATIGYTGGPPVKSGLAYTDPISGVAAAGAILHALREHSDANNRDSVHIDLAEREVVLPFITEQMIDYQLNGRVPQRLGNRHPVHWPQGCYRCAGHDRWIVLTVTDDGQWRELCGLIGLTQLRGLIVDEREASAEAIDGAISSFCAARDPYGVVRALQAHGIPSAVVQNGRDIYFDPQLRSRKFFTAVPHALVGRKEYHRFLGAVFEKTLNQPMGPAPLLDEHTEEILRSLGLDTAAIDHLRTEGVWGHQLVDGSRSNLALPLDALLSIGAVSCLDSPPVVEQA